MKNNVEIVEIMLNQGADTEIKTSTGWTPLHFGNVYLLFQILHKQILKKK